MRERDVNAAKMFDVLEKCQAFERDLLRIKDVVPDEFEEGIPFDLNGFYSNIFQVIVLPKYDIRANREDYWGARAQLKDSVIALAEKYDLHRTGDRIEDHGEHFYFVFNCGASWQNAAIRLS